MAGKKPPVQRQVKPKPKRRNPNPRPTKKPTWEADASKIEANGGRVYEDGSYITKRGQRGKVKGSPAARDGDRYSHPGFYGW